MELNSELDRLRKYAEIESELQRATKKHPNYPTDMFQQLAIMQEEAGEVTKAVLDYHNGVDSIEHVKEELIQTAAMCMRMLNNLQPKQGRVKCYDANREVLKNGDYVLVQNKKDKDRIYKKKRDGQLYFKPYGEEERVSSYFSDDILKVSNVIS